jgi:hypothetical protein
MDRRNLEGGVRGSVPKPMRLAHQYLYYRDAERGAKGQKEEAGGKNGAALKDYILEHGEANGDHIDWNFPDPLEIGESVYLGLRAQASSSVLMDEEAAIELLDKKGLTDRVRKEVTAIQWDWSELFELNQEGLISDAEFDALMETQTNYSLVVIQ